MEPDHQTPGFVNGFLGQILRESTLHGVKYIGLPNMHMSERIFWILAVLVLCGFSIYLVEDVYTKFFANPVIISFQPKETDISQIPFPAITICNVNILKRQKILDVYYKLVEEIGKLHAANKTSTPELVDALILSEHLAHYCLAAPSFRRVLQEFIFDTSGHVDVVDAIQVYLEQGVGGDHINVGYDEMSEMLKQNVTNFLDEAAHDCNDMILKCMWARKEVDCNEIFNDIKTSNGRCCVFNMMPEFILRKIPDNDTRAEEERKWWSEDEIADWKEFGKSGKVVDLDEHVEDENVHFPLHQLAGGKLYGLSLLLNPEINKYGTCNTNDAAGFKLVAHSPISFPAISDYGVAIPPNAEVFVDMEPTLSVAKDSLKSIPIDKRGCYFPNDQYANLKNYKFYSGANCVDECIANVTYSNCSCVRYFMPKNSSQNLCGAKKLKCAEEVRENLTKSGRNDECSICKPACTEVKYRLKLSHFPLREDDSMPYKYYDSYSDTNKTVGNYSIVHIFIGTDKVYAKERKSLYEPADLLANAGGLLSLTLGFSVVSIIEIIYFATLRAYFYFKSKSDEDGLDSSDMKQAKTIAVVKPRIQEGLCNNVEKAGMDYINWAVTATSVTKKVIVKPKRSPGHLSGISRRKVGMSQQAKEDQKMLHFYQYLN